MNKLQIAVIGSAGPEEYKNIKPDTNVYKIAYDLGCLIAKKGAVLISGGEGGIMKSASKGAKSMGGITVGILGGNKRGRANIYIDVELVSGSENYSEEAITISSSDGVIAVGGGAGTLQEMALAYRNGKPIVAIAGVGGYSAKLAGKFIDERRSVKILRADTPKQAIDLLFKLIK